jgi:hypothetical protein
LHLADRGTQLQFLPQLQQIRETWTAKYGYTFGPGALEPTPPPPPPPPTPTERETERVDLLDRVLPTDLAAWTTLDDPPTAELRNAVAHVHSMMGRESVARCVQALWRYNGTHFAVDSSGGKTGQDRARPVRRFATAVLWFRVKSMVDGIKLKSCDRLRDVIIVMFGVDLSQWEHWVGSRRSLMVLR